jgi:hypothetical protein
MVVMVVCGDGGGGDYGAVTVQAVGEARTGLVCSGLTIPLNQQQHWSLRG